MPKIPKPRAVGASIYAGGFTVGVLKHFDVLCHLEESNYGVPTFKANYPHIPIHIGFDKWPIEELKGIDLVYGNPPCAAWSRAGRVANSGHGKNAWKSDKRPECTLRHFSLLERIRPKVWVWESVVGAFTFGREFVDSLIKRANRLGYSVSLVLHDARHLGLAQRRVRFFMVCHSIEIPFTHNQKPPVCVSDVLRSVTDPGPLPLMGVFDRFQKWIPKVKPDEALRVVFDRLFKNPKFNDQGKIKGRPAFCVRRLPEKGLAKTCAGFMTVHPIEHRPLGIREQLALCGYPLDYKLEGPLDNKPMLIVRGVCPPVGEWLAKIVANAIRLDKKLSRPKVTLYDFRKTESITTDLTDHYQ